jgi:RimJ/RimL family protein N-acetyltransferase
MLIELMGNEIEKVAQVFSKLEFCTPVYAIIKGNSLSRVFVDNRENPGSAFMWNAFRYSYIAGNPNNRAFNDEVAKLLKNDLFIEGKASDDPTMVLYADDTEWFEKLEELLPEKYPLSIHRQQFKFNSNLFEGKVFQNVDDGIEIKKVDRELLEGIGGKILEDIRISWSSLENFLDNGIGFVLLKGNELISSCHSCFADGHSFETSVKTYNEKLRKKGFATAVTKKYLEYCLENDIEPKWECWEGNQPSERLAEKVGFEKTGVYPVQFVLLNEVDEYMENAFHCLFNLEKYKESAVFFEKAFGLMNDVEPENLYFCSCALALSGNCEKACDYLNLAIEKGFGDKDKIENEKAFECLKKDIRWDTLLQKL